MFGEDAGEFRETFLGFVLVVAGDQDDLFAFGRAIGAFVDEWRSTTAGADGQAGDGEQGGEETFHGWGWQTDWDATARCFG